MLDGWVGYDDAVSAWYKDHTEPFDRVKYLQWETGGVPKTIVTGKKKTKHKLVK